MHVFLLSRWTKRLLASPTRSVALHIFFSSSPLRDGLRRAAGVPLSRSSLFPATPFSLFSEVSGPLSRLAPGHYLIFRLETPHPQEKRSDRGKKAGRESPLVVHAEDQRCLRVITFVSASVFLSLLEPRPYHAREIPRPSAYHDSTDSLSRYQRC